MKKQNTLEDLSQSKKEVKKTTKKTPAKEAHKTKVVEKVEKPYPTPWKEMDKIDAKLIKLTSSLEETLQSAITLMRDRLETSKQQAYYEDLKDYLGWVIKINEETTRFYKYGKG